MLDVIPSACFRPLFFDCTSPMIFKYICTMDVSLNGKLLPINRRTLSSGRGFPTVDLKRYVTYAMLRR